MLFPAADAGSAGVGRYGFGSRPDRVEVIMAAERPDFRAEWAVQGSNLRPWD
jgi:hypothetical protein